MIPAPVNDDPFELIGTTLGEKYRVDRLLGQGGFGVVYGGNHALIDAPVAIKCLRPMGFAPKASAAASDLFLREAKVLFTLSHPAIVRLYDMGAFTREGCPYPYLVLELLRGGTLDEQIAERAQAGRHFSGPELLTIFQPVLEAVAYAHKKGVVHRDLKPSNIMLSETDSLDGAKVVDFGIARWTEDRKTKAGTTMMFSPAYAAPEQWDSELGPTDAITDIFLLGLVLAEAALLAPALDLTTSPLQAMQQALTVSTRLNFALRRPDLARLANVVERATIADRSARFQSVDELLVELKAALDHEHDASSAPVPLAPPSSANIRKSVTSAETIAGPSAAPVGPAAVRSAVPAEAPSAVRLVVPKAPATPSAAPAPPSMTPVSVRGAEPVADRRWRPEVSRARASIGPARILLSDENHCTATCGPVFIVVWKGEVTVDAATAIRFAIRDFAASHPGGRIGLATVVEANAPMPSADARTALANILRFTGEALTASAVAMRGDGFRGAAIRGVATGIALLARQPCPHRVFPTIETAAVWLTKMLSGDGVPISGADLAHIIGELSAAMSAKVRRST